MNKDKELELIRMGIELLDEWQKDKLLMFIYCTDPSSLDDSISILFDAKKKIGDAVTSRMLEIKAT